MWRWYVARTYEFWSSEPELAVIGMGLCLEGTHGLSEHRPLSLLPVLRFLAKAVAQTPGDVPQVPTVDVLLSHHNDRPNSRDVVYELGRELNRRSLRVAILSKAGLHTVDGEGLLVDPDWSRMRGASASLLDAAHGLWTLARRSRRLVDVTRELRREFRFELAPSRGLELLYSAVFGLRLASRLLKRLRPRVILLTHERWPPAAHWIQAARLLPTGQPEVILLQHGALSLAEFPVLADEFWVRTEPQIAAARRFLDLSSEKSVVHIGVPEADLYRSASERSDWRRETYLDLGLPLDSPLLVHLTSYCEDHELCRVIGIEVAGWLRQIAEKCPHVGLVIKANPLYDEMGFWRSFTWPDNVRITDSISYEKLLSTNCFVSTDASSGLSVAAALGKFCLRLCVPALAAEFKKPETMSSLWFQTEPFEGIEYLYSPDVAIRRVREISVECGGSHGKGGRALSSFSRMADRIQEHCSLSKQL